MSASAKYAVIDTETSSLMDFSKAAEAEGQARLASLAIVLLDENLIEIDRTTAFILPDGWEMKEEATKVNGLTTEILLSCGVPVVRVLGYYASLIDSGIIICSFNAQFDTKVMRELRRAKMDDRFERTPNICIMRAFTDVCKIPKKKGAGYKFPKLSEACAMLNIPQPAAHSAIGDAISAAHLLRELHRMHLMPKPEVHFAKVQPTKLITTNEQPAIPPGP